VGRRPICYRLHAQAKKCNTAHVLWSRRLLAAAAVLALGAPLGVPYAASGAASETASPMPAGVISPGVSVAGVPVGGMTAAQAQTWVGKSVLGDVTVSVGPQTWSVPAAQLGLHAYLARPLRVALAEGRTTAVDGQDIPVVTRITGSALRAWVRSLAPQVKTDPVDAGFRLVNGVPRVVADVWGRKLDIPNATAAIAAALKQPDRGPIELPTTVVKPAVTARTLPPALVVDRALHRVTLYSKRAAKLRMLGVAVGQSQYPTPVGRFEIVTKQANPWWYPPNSAWAAGEKPVPPGPGNPLGTRWMGISAPGVGLHGTPDAASIGYSASHGCIRMRIPDAEWLFTHVRVGSPVWIIH
jgi:lipoprotein-anchoring transpeptidase ErfK/SrfK